MLNTVKYLTYIFLFREKYISLQYKTLTNNLFYNLKFRKMAKITFSVKNDVANITESEAGAFENALTPRRYVELFMSAIEDVVDPVTSLFAGIFLPSIVGVWTKDFEDAAKINYIILNGDITPCVIFKNYEGKLVFLVKHNYGKRALAEKVNVEDGDCLFTTMKDAKLYLLSGADSKNDTVKPDEKPSAPEEPSVQEKIRALNKEKMECLTRIRKINKELTALNGCTK